MYAKAYMAFFIFILKNMKLGLHSISFWFSSFMILIVVTGAIALTFTDAMSDRLVGTKRVVFIFILLAYAFYRGIRMYQTYKYSKHDE